MDFIDIHKLNMDELAGVVNLYPWFGGARRELCKRMSKLGGEDWGNAQYADQAMYIGSRKVVSDIAREDVQVDYSDRNIEDILSKYIGREEDDHQVEKEQSRPVRVVGGDYFTQSEYDNVKSSDDNVFSRFATKVKGEASEPSENVMDDFCTETLAQIYAEQGYYEQAKHIYSKLILEYPEKNAYFVALIEKLNQN